jgi:CTP synthase
LDNVDGIIIPGGFGVRGIEGKIAIAQYARMKGIPFLGICLGMQVAVIEFARHVCGMKMANSTEFDPDNPYPVIHLIESQQYLDMIGGTMRLGAYPCKLLAESLACKAYGTKEISERHRHRYEVNNEYRNQLQTAGLKITGESPDGMLVEIVELTGLDFYVGVQFHPEFKSRPNNVHPLFRDFFLAASRYKQEQNG